MIRKFLGFLGMFVVAVLLIQNVTATYYLAKIDYALNSSLHSTKDLIQVQKTIIVKNRALQEIVQTTQKMSHHLTSTLGQTVLVAQHIHAIGDLNAKTLSINQGLVTIGSHNKETLSKITEEMNELAKNTTSLSNSINQLDHLIQQDRTNLDQMKVYTHEMNEKTPGVVR